MTERVISLLYYLSRCLLLYLFCWIASY